MDLEDLGMLSPSEELELGVGNSPRQWLKDEGRLEHTKSCNFGAPVSMFHIG
jgi:hypothetical protein